MLPGKQPNESIWARKGLYPDNGPGSDCGVTRDCLQAHLIGMLLTLLCGARREGNEHGGTDQVQ
jgi:hypothetical protein